MKRALSIISIIFLLGITTAMPYFSCSSFVYADDPVENLSTEEVVQAAITTYLNERKAWIVNQTGDSIDSVKAVMNSWINCYDLWANHTIVGSFSEFYAGIIIKYHPFRIALKGSAVRALNDLYSWLVESGKLGNLENSNGGITSDNLYNGKLLGNSLFYIINSQYADNNNPSIYGYFGKGSNFIQQLGTPVNGVTASFIHQQSGFNDFSNADASIDLHKSITCQYSANTTISYDLVANGYNMMPSDLVSLYRLSDKSGLGTGVTLRSARCLLYTTTIRGNSAWILDRNDPNYMVAGLVSYCPSTGVYCFYRSQKIVMSNDAQSIDVNLDTDNFDKVDPTPPSDDDEITYTPVDKTTGNTFNTYNEYINNYVTKNTTINKTYNDNGGGSNNDPYPLDPENPSDPGGTVPDWSGGGDSGSLDPDGNGGFTFNLPDFSLPDLDINWSISGLSEKFPFSIPFDLLAFFTVLNAEPQTPEIQATIPLGLWEWNIDWDLHDFDNLAGLLRNLEFIGFCIGLALITRNIIKG